ncbi:hypothetical protein [Spirosoma oryzicola]|nr:hypothetical protein [Spirosoma oryzicola]UHG94643.1 hypothetical protein LQ777_29030 [Spirosoma oryzicola]
MHPLMALFFMAASASLLLHTNDKSNRLGQLLTSLPVLIGFLVLVRHLTG